MLGNQSLVEVLKIIQGYGIHLPERVFTAPFKESMGQLPEPAGSQIYYCAFEELLDKQRKGKTWMWCEVRPDAIASTSHLQCDT